MEELDIDIALHDEGPGPAWAMGVKEGAVAVISGRPGGTYFPDVDADWYLIGGDEAALPAIGTLLEALPSSIRAYVLAEVRDADEELELESAAGLQIRWLHRRAGEMPGRALAAAMREAELPQAKAASGSAARRPSCGRYGRTSCMTAASTAACSARKATGRPAP